MSEKPLAGKTILDLSQNLPGPYCSHLLLDMGARVIKVEPPKGDPSRQIEDFFQVLNTGKELVALNLKSPEGLRILKSLIVKADVLLETFRPGVMEKLGLGFKELETINPHLLVVSINGLGSVGPLRNLPVHDINLQAMSGVLQLKGAGDNVLANPLPIADFSAAYVALAQILAAFYQQSQRGQKKAQKIEVNMLEGLAHMTNIWDQSTPISDDAAQKISLFLKNKAKTHIPMFFLSQIFSEKNLKKLAKYFLSAGVLSLLPHYGIFRVKNGRIALGIVDEDNFWREFSQKLGAPLSFFSSFKLGGRVLLGPLIKLVIKGMLRRRDIQQILNQFQNKSQLPITKVNTVAEAAAEAQLKFLNRVRFTSGKASVLSPFAQQDQTEVTQNNSPLKVPSLGQDNERILSEFGYSKVQIDEFRQNMVVLGA